MSSSTYDTSLLDFKAQYIEPWKPGEPHGLAEALDGDIKALARVMQGMPLPEPITEASRLVVIEADKTWTVVFSKGSTNGLWLTANDGCWILSDGMYAWHDVHTLGVGYTATYCLIRGRQLTLEPLEFRKTQAQAQ
jgi:hypothetical protein